MFIFLVTCGLGGTEGQITCYASVRLVKGLIACHRCLLLSICTSCHLVWKLHPSQLLRSGNGYSVRAGLHGERVALAVV